MRDVELHLLQLEMKLARHCDRFGESKTIASRYELHFDRVPLPIAGDLAI